MSEHKRDALVTLIMARRFPLFIAIFSQKLKSQNNHILCKEMRRRRLDPVNHEIESNKRYLSNHAYLNTLRDTV